MPPRLAVPSLAPLLAVSLAPIASVAPEPPAREPLPLVQERGAPPRYAALPWRDLTASPAATADLSRRVRVALEARGAEFADAERVESVLYERRIRYTDTLSRRAVDAIVESTGCDYVLLGTLLEYDPRVPPRVGLALRVLDGRTGERVASTLASASGEDFTGLLLLGTIEDVEELGLEVLARALAPFGPDGAPSPAAARGAEELTGATRAITAFQREGFDPASLERVALMPLEDRSRWPNAARRLDEILAHVWFLHAGVQVVETSELRDAMVRERVRSIEQLDLALLRRLGESVGARHFLMGSLQEYNPDVPADGELVPELELFVRLFDTVEQRVVAGAAIRLRGDDYRTVLGLGTVNDPTELARRAALSATAIVGGSR